MPANFSQFGAAKPDTAPRQNKDLGFTFSATEDDFKNADHSFFRPVKPGDYDATIIDIQFGESKKGNHMATIVLRIDDDEGEVHINDYLVMMTNTIWKFFTVVKWAGLKEDVIQHGVTDETWQKMIGRSGRIRVKQEVQADGPYANKPQNRVDRYL